MLARRHWAVELQHAPRQACRGLNNAEMLLERDHDVKHRDWRAKEPQARSYAIVAASRMRTTADSADPGVVAVLTNEISDGALTPCAPTSRPQRHSRAEIRRAWHAMARTITVRGGPDPATSSSALLELRAHTERGRPGETPLHARR